MHEAPLVRFRKRATGLAYEHDHALGWLRSKSRHDAMEIEAVQILHDVIEASGVVDAEVVELHRVWRAQCGSHVRFALETPYQLISRRARRDIVANELDGRRPDEDSMFGEPDFAHAAGTERADEAIAPHGHGFVQLLRIDLEHRAFADEHGPFDHCSQLADVS